MNTFQSIVILALIYLIVYLAVFHGKNNAKVYPCHLAEISPDYPPDVKVMCRRLTRKVQEQ
jgi:hypothetical protein